jgi:hypothetical protein
MHQGRFKALEYTLKRTMSTTPLENYKASFSTTPGENPLFIRVGPKKAGDPTIFKAPNMNKFWPETADVEAKVSAHESIQSFGFSRAPCSERVVSNPLQEISENIQASSASSGNLGMINENVTVTFSSLNQQPNGGANNQANSAVLSNPAVNIVQTENSLIDEIGMFSSSSDMLENISQFTESSLFQHVNIDLWSPVTSPAGPLAAI